ncbi:MAG TPA: hypothetical protein VNA23_05730 [Anaerolineales bacterium]|nr:hypothetical protein [Anaerolineales bacterium]
MKAVIHPPVHESYKRYRKQLVSQIILPMIITALLFVGMIVLISIATFRDGGDVGRWAAISTIWIAVPIMIAALIFIVLLTGMVYLLKRLLQITPTYTGRLQDFIYMVAVHIKRAADATVKPVFFLDGIGASIKRLLGGNKP